MEISFILKESEQSFALVDDVELRKRSRSYILEAVALKAHESTREGAKREDSAGWFSGVEAAKWRGFTRDGPVMNAKSRCLSIALSDLSFGPEDRGSSEKGKITLHPSRFMRVSLNGNPNCRLKVGRSAVSLQHLSEKHMVGIGRSIPAAISNCYYYIFNLLKKFPAQLNFFISF